MTTPTVFHITHHKAGSQWLLALLSASAPGRIVWPDEQLTPVRKHPIFQGMVYPTIYLTKAEFDAIPQPGPFRAFVVIRDLRDTLISLYLHLLRSDVSARPFKARVVTDVLSSKSLTEGLRFTMHTYLKGRAWIQMSWLNSGFPIFRYEDLILNDEKGIGEIFRYCEIDVSASRLKELVKAHSFQSVSGRSLGVEDENSHLRQGLPGDWRNYLHGDLLDEFKDLYGELLIRSGYENDWNWGGESKRRPRTVSTAALTNSARSCWCGGLTRPFGERFTECADCGTKVNNLVFSSQPIVVDSDDEELAWEESLVFSTRLNIGAFREKEGALPIEHRARREVAGNYAPQRVLGVLRYKDPGANVLDVGCGSGSIVALMHQVGLSAIGMDVRPANVEFARETFGVEVVEEDFEKWQSVGGAFDAISMFDVLQYLKDPLGALKKCFDLLQKDGLLMIETIDFPEDIHFEELGYKRPDCMDHLKFSRHLHLFNRRALTLLFEKAGFIFLEEADGILFCSKSQIPAKTNVQIDEHFQVHPERRLALAVLDQFRARQYEAQLTSDRAIQLAEQLWKSFQNKQSKPQLKMV